MNVIEGAALFGPTLSNAFAAEKLPPEWGMAIACQESRFNPMAMANSGGDGARGGSRGLCQMSLMTARALGYSGDPDGLFDAKLNAALAAKLCAQLVSQFKSTDLQDIAAGYNSGHRFSSAPSSTATIYVPNVLEYAKNYKKMAAGFVAAVNSTVVCPRCGTSIPLDGSAATAKA